MKESLTSIVLATALLCSSACTTTPRPVQNKEYPKKALFSEDVLNTLISAYSGMETENLLCFEGEETPEKFLVTGVYPASVSSRDSISVSGSCRNADRYNADSYLGTVHNHPVSRACRLSETDKAWFYMGSRERVYGVVCQADDDIDRLEFVVKTKPLSWYNSGRDTTQISRSIIKRGEYYTE